MSDSSDDTDADDEEEFKQNQKRASEWWQICCRYSCRCFWIDSNHASHYIYALNNYRLTEEEDSVPTGPPRTKNEIAFDNSHIYDPDAMETGCFNNDCDGTSAPLDFDREKVNISIVSDELNEIGTIMYVVKNGTSISYRNFGPTSLYYCYLCPCKFHSWHHISSIQMIMVFHPST